MNLQEIAERIAANTCQIEQHQREIEELHITIEDALASGKVCGQEENKLAVLEDSISTLEATNRGLQRQSIDVEPIEKQKRLQELYGELQGLGTKSQGLKVTILDAVTEVRDSKRALEQVVGRFQQLEHEAKALCKFLGLPYEPQASLESLNRFELDEIRTAI